MTNQALQTAREALERIADSTYPPPLVGAAQCSHGLTAGEGCQECICEFAAATISKIDADLAAEGEATDMGPLVTAWQTLSPHPPEGEEREEPDYPGGDAGFDADESAMREAIAFMPELFHPGLSIEQIARCAARIMRERYEAGLSARPVTPNKIAEGLREAIAGDLGRVTRVEVVAPARSEVDGLVVRDRDALAQKFLDFYRQSPGSHPEIDMAYQTADYCLALTRATPSQSEVAGLVAEPRWDAYVDADGEIQVVIETAAQVEARTTPSVEPVLGEVVSVLRACIQRIERPNLSPDGNVIVERINALLSRIQAGGGR